MRASASAVRAAILAAASVVPATVAAQTTDYAMLEQVMGEPVTSSVVGTPQRASDVPADVTIITRADIAAAPARDVPGLLQRYGGIDVTRYTAGHTEVAIRGGPEPYNARLLVLVDGRQVYLDHYGMTNWNLLGIQLEDIQQIEIVRGPASALFGFNAVTGVVNIITLDGITGRAATLRAAGGNHGTRRIAGIYAGSISPEVALRVSAGSMREDERRGTDAVPSDGRIGPVTRDELSGTLTGLLGGRTRVIVSGGYSWNAQQEMLPGSFLTRQRFGTGHFMSQVQHDTSWGAINARSYTNDLHARYGVDGEVPVDGYRQRVFVSQANAIVRLGGVGSLRLGGEYRDNRLHSDSALLRTSYRLAAATGMMDVRPFRSVTVSLAARADRLMPRDTTYSFGEESFTARAPALTAVSFNAGVVARLGARDQLRVNGGRGLQLPSLIETGNVAFALDAGFRIRPDVVWSVEGGYRHRFGDLLTAEVGGYWARNGRSVLFIFPDLGSFTSTGLSVAGNGIIAPGLSWKANYTLAIVRPAGAARRDTGNTLGEGIAPWLSTPRNKANLVLDYAGAGRLSGAVAARYTASNRQFVLRDFMPTAVRVPDALAIDARLGLRLTSRFELRATGENLTGARGAGGALIPGDRRWRAGIAVTL